MRSIIVFSAIIICGAIDISYANANANAFLWIVCIAFVWDMLEVINKMKRKDENICNDTDDSNSKSRFF